MAKLTCLIPLTLTREREIMSKIKYEPEIDDLIKMKEEEEASE
jgi:hypothetical protein